MPGKMEMQFSFENKTAKQSKRQSSDAPLRILVMGDFSGNDAGKPSLAQRLPVMVDIDNVEHVFDGFQPKIKFELEGSEVEINFSSFEDLHPDQLYDHLDIFKVLKEQHDRLCDPYQFKDTLSELLGDTPLSGGVNKSSSESQTGDVVQRLLHKAITPHIVPDHGPQQTELINCSEQVIASLMQKLLHHPVFQDFERGWRSVEWLVDRVETGQEVSVHLLDIDKETLQKELLDPELVLEKSTLYQLLVEQPSALGATPWSLLIGDYRFSNEMTDAQLLAAMGALTSQVGGSFIAGAESNLVGCKDWLKKPYAEDWQPLESDFNQLWNAVKQSPMGEWVGLVAPGFMLRQPYGKRSDEIERFQFQEITDPRQQSQFLWANGAFACAQLLASDFLYDGWEMQPGNENQVEDLPLYTYLDAGDPEMVPCAQAYLGQNAINAIAAQGIMPLASVLSQNRAKCTVFQTISGSSLAPWRF